MGFANLNGNGTVAAHDPQSALEPMLTPEEVAKLLNISKSTLCRLTKRGEIPHKRLGDRVVRYSRAAIVAWMADQNS